MGFPGGSDGNETACNAGDLGSIPGLRRSPGRPTLVFLPGESPWTEEPSELCPWGHKKSDMTEQLTLSLSETS